MKIEIPDHLLAAYHAKLRLISETGEYDAESIESLETNIACVAVTQYQKAKGLR